MNQRNIKIGNNLYEVITEHQFALSPTAYDVAFTAILFESRVDIYGNMVPNVVLPFRNTLDFARGIPGIYGVTLCDNGQLGLTPLFDIIWPYHFENGTYIIDNPEYLTTNSNMLDTTNLDKMQELIDMDAKFREFEFDIITASDNATHFTIRPNDTLEMAATKEALNAKHIDIDKYRMRIGSTFANDKRFLQNSPSITFNKLKTLFPALDLKCTLTIDNSSPDVPNPIPHPITVTVTDFAAASDELEANIYTDLDGEKAEDNSEEEDEEDV